METVYSEVSTSGSEVLTSGNEVERGDYWANMAQQWKKEALAAKEELEEFQEGSRELELELEAQLGQQERKLKDLETINTRLQLENEQLRVKLEDSRFGRDEKEIELEEVKGINEELQGHVRQLEQQNDDLERAKRSALASLEDCESRMNAAIERNVFLESELEEKETLKMTVQRLKDEKRDLQSELKILNSHVFDQTKDFKQLEIGEEVWEDSHRKIFTPPRKLGPEELIPSSNGKGFFRRMSVKLFRPNVIGQENIEDGKDMEVDEGENGDRKDSSGEQEEFSGVGPMEETSHTPTHNKGFLRRLSIRIFNKRDCKVKWSNN